MPELPEVETVRRTLKNFILNKTIKDVCIYYDKIVVDDNQYFCEVLKNKTIQDIDRVGKYLVFLFEDVAFISHLRMEGKYFIRSKDEDLNKHDHVTFTFDNGEVLCYNDTRKFGRIELVDKDTYRTSNPLGKLGSEPKDATVEEIYPKIHKSNLPIKTVLLNQSILCGIGNIYANEICFHMKINPYTKASSLTKKRVQELLDISSFVLQKAIDQGGTTIHSFDAMGIHGLFQVELVVHMQKTCKVCGGPITKEMIHQRGTYYCKTCQRRKR